MSERETLRKIINEILEKKQDAAPVEDLSDELSLTEQVGLDSLDLAEMTVRIEDQYDVDVFEDDIVETVGDVLEKVDT